MRSLPICVLLPIGLVMAAASHAGAPSAPPAGVYERVDLTPEQLAYYRNLGLRDRQIVHGALLAQRIGIPAEWVLRRIVRGEPPSVIAGDYQLPPGEQRMAEAASRSLVAALPPRGAEATFQPTREAVAGVREELAPPVEGYTAAEWQRFRGYGLSERQLRMAAALARRVGLPASVVAARLARGDSLAVLAGDYGIRVEELRAEGEAAPPR